MSEKKEFIKYIKEKFPLDLDAMTVNGTCISDLKSETIQGILIGFSQKDRQILIPRIWNKMRSNPKYIFE